MSVDRETGQRPLGRPAPGRRSPSARPCSCPTATSCTAAPAWRGTTGRPATWSGASRAPTSSGPRSATGGLVVGSPCSRPTTARASAAYDVGTGERAVVQPTASGCPSYVGPAAADGVVVAADGAGTVSAYDAGGAARPVAPAPRPPGSGQPARRRRPRASWSGPGRVAVSPTTTTGSPRTTCCTGALVARLEPGHRAVPASCRRRSSGVSEDGHVLLPDHRRPGPDRGGGPVTDSAPPSARGCTPRAGCPGRLRSWSAVGPRPALGDRRSATRSARVGCGSTPCRGSSGSWPGCGLVMLAILLGSMLLSPWWRRGEMISLIGGPQPAEPAAGRDHGAHPAGARPRLGARSSGGRSTPRSRCGCSSRRRSASPWASSTIPATTQGSTAGGCGTATRSCTRASWCSCAARRVVSLAGSRGPAGLRTRRRRRPARRRAGVPVHVLPRPARDVRRGQRGRAAQHDAVRDRLGDQRTSHQLSLPLIFVAGIVVVDLALDVSTSLEQPARRLSARWALAVLLAAARGQLYVTLVPDRQVWLDLVHGPAAGGRLDASARRSLLVVVVAVTTRFPRPSASSTPRRRSSTSAACVLAGADPPQLGRLRHRHRRASPSSTRCGWTRLNDRGPLRRHLTLVPAGGRPSWRSPSAGG